MNSLAPMGQAGPSGLAAFPAKADTDERSA